MTEHNSKALKEQARANAREILSQSASFQGLAKTEQFSLYKDVVDSEYQKLARTKSVGNGSALAGQMGNAGASQLIDDSRHKVDINQFKQGLDAGVDFIDQINFPQFVKDLLKGVFDANLEVTGEQMQDYQALLKSASASTASFIKEISKEDSFAYLVDNSEDDLGLSFEEDSITGEQTPILMDKDGNAIDTEDSKIKAKIMDAQLALAKERRAMLREMILMGVSRLVIEKGKIRAAVKFDIKSSSKTVTSDKAITKDKEVKTSTRTSGGSWYHPTRKSDVSRNRKTQISISSAKGSQDASVAASMTGEVEINFKSDYFKLDNFAELYKSDKKEDKQTPT